MAWHCLLFKERKQQKYNLETAYSDHFVGIKHNQASNDKKHIQA